MSNSSAFGKLTDRNRRSDATGTYAERTSNSALSIAIFYLWLKKYRNDVLCGSKYISLFGDRFHGVIELHSLLAYTVALVAISFKQSLEFHSGQNQGAKSWLPVDGL
jgi:hypothetical protein